MGERYFIWQIVERLRMDGIKVHAETIRRWDRSGKIHLKRTNNHERFITPSEYPTFKLIVIKLRS